MATAVRTTCSIWLVLPWFDGPGMVRRAHA
jgi:hypothetical protein